MNYLATTIFELLKSNLKDSSVRIYLYLYCDAGGFGKPARLTNVKISEELHMNIKTIYSALSELKKFGYIEIAGKTSNRQITCFDPFVLNETESC
ncbi:MAG: hypothetical protein GY756_22525 [bacterium]|nr:hypothetical protein [bacterium]